MTNLTPGPDLDRRVAEAVGWKMVTMGFRYPLVFDAAAIEYPTPSLDECDALAALEATGQEFIITSIVGDPGHRAYIVQIEDINMDEPFISTRLSTLPLAICAAILAWKEGQEDE